MAKETKQIDIDDLTDYVLLNNFDENELINLYFKMYKETNKTHYFEIAHFLLVKNFLRGK